jgi:hypothetical protein
MQVCSMAVAFMLLWLTSAAQEPQLSGKRISATVLSNLSSVSADLVTRIELFPNSDESRRTVLEASRRIASAGSLLGETDVSSDQVDEYDRSVGDAVDALRRLLTSRLTPDRRLDIYIAVEKDLLAKANAARKTAGWGNAGPNKKRAEGCEVRVITMRGSREVEGCTVWFVPVAWEDTSSRYQRFDRKSSPTTRRLMPGYYKFWAEVGGAVGKRQPHEVTGLQVIEIDAP